MRTTTRMGENAVGRAEAKAHLYTAFYVGLTFQPPSFKNLIHPRQKSIIKCLANVHPFRMHVPLAPRTRVQKPTVSRKPDGDGAASDRTLEAKRRELRDSETFSSRGEMFTNMSLWTEERGAKPRISVQVSTMSLPPP